MKAMAAAPSTTGCFSIPCSSGPLCHGLDLVACGVTPAATRAMATRRNGWWTIRPSMNASKPDSSTSHKVQQEFFTIAPTDGPLATPSAVGTTWIRLLVAADWAGQAMEYSYILRHQSLQASPHPASA